MIRKITRASTTHPGSDHPQAAVAANRRETDAILGVRIITAASPASWAFRAFRLIVLGGGDPGKGRTG